MVTLSYDNVWCYVDGTDDEKVEIMEILSYSVKGAWYTKKYKNKSWNGKSTFYLPSTDRFPAGLINYVIHYCKDLEFDLNNKIPTFPINNYKEIDLWDEINNQNLELRDYQQKSIDIFLSSKRGVIDLPTRSGKTVIGIGASQALDCPTLFIVPTKGLFTQTQREYKNKMNVVTGAIGDSKFSIKKITVALPKSIKNTLEDRVKRRELLEYLSTVRFIIVDEVHRLNKTYAKFAKNFIAADYRMGLSATPFSVNKENKLRILGIIGDTIYKVKMKKLVDDKHIAKPTVTFVKMPPDRGELHFEWDDLYYHGIVANPTRNALLALIAMQQLRKGKRSLILYEKLEHGDNLYDLLYNKAKVEVVHGGHTSKFRDEKLLEFEKGKIDILITSRIFNEGINIPFLQSVIIAGGYKSAVLLFQRYGRGITRTEDKENTDIFDVLDPYGRLKDHAQKRYNMVKKNDAFEVKVINIEDL